MTNKELQAIRKLLMLEVSEAAIHIAGLKGPRSWQYWESGKYLNDDGHIKQDVAEKMQELASKRIIMIETVEDLMREHPDSEPDITYYMSHAEYAADHRGATVIDWRLSQSVAAYFFGEGFATLT